MEKRHNVQRQWEWEEEREIACCWMQKSPDKYENPKSGGRKKEPKQGSKRRRKKHALYKHLWRNKSSVFLPRRLNRSWLERGLVAWTTPKSRVSRDKLQPFFTTFSLIRSGLFVLLQKEFCSLPRSVFLSLYLSLSKSRARFRSLSVRMAGLLKRSGRGWSLVCLFLHATKSVLCVCVFLTRERICLPRRRRRREKSKSKKRKKNSLFRCIKKIISSFTKRIQRELSTQNPHEQRERWTAEDGPPQGRILPWW